MQGVRKRLDQTFPARKVTSNDSLAKPMLETLSSAMDKENYAEGSIHQNGTPEIYLTASLGDSRSGPTLGKCGASLGKKSPNSWLTRCGPRVSKFTPPRPMAASKFIPPRPVEPKVNDENSQKPNGSEASGGPIRDTVLEDEPVGKPADKRKLDLHENFSVSKKHRVEDDSEDDVIACTPLLDITNVSRGVTKKGGTQCQELTVSQRSFWIDDEEICDVLPGDVDAGRDQWMEEEHCRLPKVDDSGLEVTENGMSLPEAMQEIFRACEAEKHRDECQIASYNGSFEFDTVERVICSPEPMSPEAVQRAIDPATGGSDFHLRSPGNGGGLCWIPPPGKSKVVESFGTLFKGEGGQENGSSFSPGDAFWDEAFEAVNGILVSSFDKQAPEQSSPGYQKSVDVARGREEMKVDGRLYSQVVGVKKVEEFSKAATQQITMKEKTPGNSMLESEHDTKNAAGSYDNFEISPLPVRRFNFSDHEDVSNESIDKFVNEEVAQTMIPSRFPLAEPSIEVDPSRSSGARSELLGSSSASVKGGFELETENKNLTAMKSKPQYKVELCKWLPPELCSFFAKKGLTKLYQWQVECLQIDGVLDGRSLVYCASTSAGKSLVAELLMLRRVLSTGKKALLVLPYVTLCSEKATHLQALLQPLGKRVRGFYGTQGGSSLPKDTSVAVCTIEKANSLINKLLEEGRLSELCIIVIDELHMVGDKDRGYLLELLLTKIRYAACCEETISDTVTETKTSSIIEWSSVLQIVGMSATMPNVSEVAKWLQAALYRTEFRPVPLEEFMKVGNTIFDKRMEIVRMIRDSADLGGKDPDHIVELCHEVVSEGHSVLVFCSSRKGCETSARHIAKHLPPCTVIKKNTNGPKDGDAAVEELRRCSAGLDPVLADTLPAGVAYHHAGLTAEERDVVETCFKSGVVRVLVATSTLAAGVNLPARRVIFRQPKIGRDFVDTTRYRQMAGRAGRAGIDTKGESILICKPDEAKRIMEMMKQDCKALESCLADDKNGMVRALLEVVAGGIVLSAADVQRYVRCTLLNATQPFEEVVKSAQDSLRWLCYKHFLEWDASAEIYMTTSLGRAAFASSLNPEESLIVFKDLAKAREGFVLASDLHLIYEVTPTYVDLEPDWGVFYQRYMDLSPIDQAVGNRVGVLEAFLLRMAHGAPILQHRNGRSRGGKGKVSPLMQKSRWKSPSGAQLPVDQLLRICKRFYVALILSYLVQEVPMLEICERFNVQKGAVQGLQESAGKFAGMVAAFCERLGWSDMGSLVTRFQKRVSFGVKSEIVDLTEIPFIKAARARALFMAGLKSIQAVAEATIDDLVNALFNNASRKGQDENSNGGQQWVQVGVARKIKNAARRLALDRAEESRAAAFSACQALGVQVNAGLALPLVAGIDEEEAKASAEVNR